METALKNLSKQVLVGLVLAERDRAENQQQEIQRTKEEIQLSRQEIQLSERTAPLSKLVAFDYQQGRGQDAPRGFLKGYQGTLQTDGYAVYKLYYAKTTSSPPIANRPGH